MAPKAQLEENGAMPQQSNHENRAGTAPLAGSPGAFVFSSAIGPRIPLAPPSDGGSGGGGESGAGGSEGAGNEGGSGGGDGGAGADGSAKIERPDYIPETWWDAEKGFKADDLNSLTAFKAEHDANMAQVPADATGYKVELPHEFKLPEGFNLPEGQELSGLIDENDPRMAEARDFALANKMSQSQFSELIALGVNLDIAEQGRIKEAVTAQKDLLGPKAVDRINAVKTWVSAKLPADQAETLTGMMFTAKSIEAFEALMRLNRGAVPGNPGAGRDSGKQEISDEDYDKMSPAERINYARQHSKR